MDLRTLKEMNQVACNRDYHDSTCYTEELRDEARKNVDHLIKLRKSGLNGHSEPLIKWIIWFFNLDKKEFNLRHLERMEAEVE